MPLLDLSLVTETLVNVIKEQISSPPTVVPPQVSVLVSPLPPDKLKGDHTIGVYLYHVVEDAHRKNLPPPGPDFPPVALTPMGLHLYYQVCAHSDVDGDTGTKIEQTLMGVAIKALHDHPVVDKTTQIGGNRVFPGGLHDTDNRFMIDLLPIQAEQALHYWTPGQKPLRLAAYYKVSVTLLEPVPASKSSGRVLLYGVYPFVRGSPRLDGSKSEVTFKLPGETAARTAEVQPAEAPVGGKITFFGSSLAGDATTLLIKKPRVPEPIEVGSDWGVLATDSEIRIVVQPNLGPSATLPGVYSAVAKVTETRLMPDNTVRSFPKTSNEVPFIVTPKIKQPILPEDTQLIVTVDFQDPTLTPGVVQVFVGPTSLTNGGSPPAAGEFEVTSPSQLRFRFPVAGTNSGDTVLFRVLVNGAESAPNWVHVP